MKILLKYLLFSTLLVLSLQACKNEPKVIVSQNDDSSLEDQTGIFANGGSGKTPSNPSVSDDVHTVVVEEILPTSKYVYLYVKENGDNFWIATTKQEVNLGETYFYKGGLLKKNFESKEHNRIFDKLFLISKLVPINHGGAELAAASQTNVAPSTPRDINREGSIKIVDLVANPEKYEGQIVQITGECVKVNPNIMDRNWMHLKDGSQDDYDLVVTSDIAVPVGHVVTMRAKVVLNKDFGAGYRYNLILEEGELVR